MPHEDPQFRPARVWAVNSPVWHLAARGSTGWARLAILLLHLVVIGGGYLGVLRIAGWREVSVWDSTTALDVWFPAMPWTIFVYMTLYLYWPITFLLAPRGRRGVEALLYQFQAQVLISLVTWIIFLVLPTEIYIREQMESLLPTSSELVQATYAHLYQVDAPWNAWPSLHVSLSLNMVMSWSHFTRMRTDRHRLWRRGRMDRVLTTISFVTWVALCTSIMTTKQHFFLDVWTGVLLSLAFWQFYLRRLLVAMESDSLQKA